MIMESQEELCMGNSSNDHSHIIKGKRTKRQRSSSPYIPAAAAVTSTSSSSSGSPGGRGATVEDYNSAVSSSVTTTTSTEEEEDMAICLIMLAQGTAPPINKNSEKPEKLISQKPEKVSQKPENSGFYVYECKTCSRSFPSFQALGGHRASHKKPKTTAEEKPRSPLTPSKPNSSEEGQNSHTNNIGPTLLALQASNGNTNTNKVNKIHECSICGSEFTSGQALGGHMRRHRAAATAGEGNNPVGTSSGNSDDSRKDERPIEPRKFLPLDLNLPAPEDDLMESNKFKDIVFSAQALVDCHY